MSTPKGRNNPRSKMSRCKGVEGFLKEWKQKKKLQQRINASKKLLHEMGQSHLLDGFSIGEKSQKDKLATQIVNTNLKLFQHALQSIETSSLRLSLVNFMGANSNFLFKNALKTPYQYLLDCAYSEKNVLFKAGLWLLKNSKAAIILVIDNDTSHGVASVEFVYHKLQKLLVDYKRFLKFEEKSIEIPLILITSTDKIKPCEQLLLENDYFGFNAEKVLLIEETMLPMGRKLAGCNKILLKSPWEILQAPIGSGGSFVSLSSQKGVDFLKDMGVEYVQVSCLSETCAFGSPLFFGWASSCRADIALKLVENRTEEEEYDIIFSMRQLNKICKELAALSFQSVSEQHEHVELVNEEWIEIKPSSPNAYRLRCSIYSVLNSCSIDRISVMQVSV